MCPNNARVPDRGNDDGAGGEFTAEWRQALEELPGHAGEVWKV